MVAKMGSLNDDIQKFSKEVVLDTPEDIKATDILKSISDIFSIPKIMDDLKARYQKVEKAAGELAKKYGLDGDVGLSGLDGLTPEANTAKNAYERAWNNVKKKIETTTWLTGGLGITGTIAQELSQANEQFLRDLRNAY